MIKAILFPSDFFSIREVDSSFQNEYEAVIENGDFEDGFDSWTRFQSNGSSIITAAVDDSDLFNCMQNKKCYLSAAPLTQHRVYQTILELPANEEDEVYTVSAWAYIPAGVTASNNLTTYSAVDRKTALCVMDSTGNILAQYNYETTNRTDSLQFGAVSRRKRQTYYNRFRHRKLFQDPYPCQL